MGINHFAQVLSNEQQIKDKNIQVYSLCPGYTATDLTENKGPQKI
jgi:short-subunit dehydrogenase